MNEKTKAVSSTIEKYSKMLDIMQITIPKQRHVS